MTLGHRQKVLPAGRRLRVTRQRQHRPSDMKNKLGLFEVDFIMGRSIFLSEASDCRRLHILPTSSRVTPTMVERSLFRAALNRSYLTHSQAVLFFTAAHFVQDFVTITRPQL